MRFDNSRALRSWASSGFAFSRSLVAFWDALSLVAPGILASAISVASLSLSGFLVVASRRWALAIWISKRFRTLGELVNASAPLNESKAAAESCMSNCTNPKASKNMPSLVSLAASWSAKKAVCNFVDPLMLRKVRHLFGGF